jgi:hypothetical protein
MVVATAVLLAFAAVAVAGASNRLAFSDDAFDNQGHGTAEYASDIRSVEIATDDVGGITIRVTLTTEGADAAGLFAADNIHVQVDSDRNRGTGIGGYELELRARGSSDGTPVFEFCVVDSRLVIWTCQPGTQGNYSQQATGANTYVLSFAFNHPWRAFDFRVTSEYLGRMDIAPNSGHWLYETRADPDNDGVFGTGDRCPRRSSRPFDSDGDGCAGPYKRLPVPGAEWRARIVGGGLVFVSFRIANAPPGTSVTVRAGGRSATRRGSGLVRGMVNRFAATGSTIVVSYRRPGRCTSTRFLRVVRTGNSFTLRPTRLTFAPPTSGGRCT